MRAHMPMALWVIRAFKLNYLSHRNARVFLQPVIKISMVVMHVLAVLAMPLWQFCL